LDEVNKIKQKKHLIINRASTLDTQKGTLKCLTCTKCRSIR